MHKIIEIIGVVLIGLLSACASQAPTATDTEAQVAESVTPVNNSAQPDAAIAGGTPTAMAENAVTLPAGPVDGQTQRRVRIPPEILQKIGFDLNQFDNEGLLTTTEGKRSIIYEYCIPRAQQVLSILSQIDFSIEVKTDTAGSKVSCNNKEALALGSSHQDSFKAIVVKIASLPFVRKIEQSRLE